MIALAALIAGLVLAYRHSATFRAIVQGAFQAAKDNVVLLLGPMGLLIRAFQLLYQNSATARQIVTGALDAILDAVNTLVDAVQNLVDWISRIKLPSLPHIPGLNMATSTAALSAGGAQTRTGGAAGPVFHISVSGALDPESTAIAIRRALERYDRRRGRPLGSSGTRASG